MYLVYFSNSAFPHPANYSVMKNKENACTEKCVKQSNTADKKKNEVYRGFRDTTRNSS